MAVSNERIVGIDAKGVRLRVRADANGGKRTVLIDGPTFIARFLQHVLQGPRGFKRIRHYGLLSAANAQAREDAAAFIQRVAGIDVACCPHCRLGHWRTIEVLHPTTRSRHGEAVQCRGPP